VGQNFGWVGHNAFDPRNNWPGRLLVVALYNWLKSKHTLQ